MKQITLTIGLYNFDELSENAKNRAIYEHRAFLLETMLIDDFISGDEEYDTPEKLEELYNAEYEYYEANDEPIIENIEINDYLFYEDGELANACTYIENHPDKNKAGKTIVKYKGVEYIAVDVA